MRALRGGAPALRALGEQALGTVAAVHRHCVTLAVTGGVVAVLPAGLPVHPWSLTVDSGLHGLTAGDRVAVKGGRVTAGPRHIDLRAVLEVRLTLDRRPDSLAGRLSILRQLAAPTPHDDPFEPAIACALDGFERSRDPEPLAGLVGVGQGLTPAGDDILVGVLATLDLTSRACARASPLRAALAGRLTALARRTSRVAAQLLDCAIHGSYAEPILALADAIAYGDEQAILLAGRQVLSIGHTSGRDTIRGVIAALAALRPEV